MTGAAYRMSGFRRTRGGVCALGRIWCGVARSIGGGCWLAGHAVGGTDLRIAGELYMCTDEPRQCLFNNRFWPLAQARVGIGDWKHDYNNRGRPRLACQPQPDTLRQSPRGSRGDREVFTVAVRTYQTEAEFPLGSVSLAQERFGSDGRTAAGGATHVLSGCNCEAVRAAHGGCCHAIGCAPAGLMIIVPSASSKYRLA